MLGVCDHPVLLLDVPIEHMLEEAPAMLLHDRLRTVGTEGIQDDDIIRDALQ